MFPQDSPFYLTDHICEWVQKRFWWHVLHAPNASAGQPNVVPPLFPASSPGPTPSLNIGMQLLADAEVLAYVVAQAFLNQVKLDMDAARYDQALPKRPRGRDVEQEEKPASRYLTPLNLTAPLTDPGTLIDRFGKIVVWYLPGVLSSARQSIIWKSALKMDESLKGSLIPGSSSWRTNPDYYKLPGTCLPLPGNINMSPAWFQQARDGKEFVPEISGTLKPSSVKPSTVTWLHETAESFALMGALVGLIHPELYAAGRQIYKNIIDNTSLVKEGDAVLEVLQFWTSPYTACGLISNCTTPVHRDNLSQAAWYDLLTTIGPYSESKLILENLGVELQYNSGTMVALLGRLIRHGITEADGSRICIAQYMRDNVVERAGIKAPEWMTLAKYGQ